MLTVTPESMRLVSRSSNLLSPMPSCEGERSAASTICLSLAVRALKVSKKKRMEPAAVCMFWTSSMMRMSTFW